MSDSNGWIKIYRKITKWEWYNDSKMVHLFIHLILHANFEDKKWKGIIIKRGQIITGRNKLHEILGISPQSIRTCIERLKSTNEITTKPTNKYTLITINKYDEYQPNETELTSKSTSELTIQQPTTNQQLTTTKNDKNDKKEKRDKAAKPREAFNFENQVNKMLSDEKDKRMPIIAFYWKAKGIRYENRDQYEAGLKRELRPAGLLTGYPRERIRKTINWLLGNSDFKWTLESVHKYIDEQLENLDKETKDNFTEEELNNIIKNI